MASRRGDSIPRSSGGPGKAGTERSVQRWGGAGQGEAGRWGKGRERKRRVGSEGVAGNERVG